MFLDKTQGLSLTCLKPIVKCLGSISYKHLNFIKLHYCQQVSHIMRIVNTRHRPWYQIMESVEVAYTSIEGVLLVKVELGCTLCRHFIMEYEGCYFPYHNHSVLCSHRVIYIKCSYKRVPYQVHSPFIVTLPNRLSRANLQWIQVAQIDMMSFQPTNLQSIIHYKKDSITTLTSRLITLSLGSRIHIKGPC